MTRDDIMRPTECKKRRAAENFENLGRVWTILHSKLLVLCQMKCMRQGEIILFKMHLRNFVKTGQFF